MPELLQFPFIVRVTDFWLSVPLLLIARSPLMVSELFTVTVAVLLPPIVNDLQTAELLIVGWRVPVKFASPITASTVDVGTPFDQLPKVVQDVLFFPVQLVVCACKMNAEAIKKKSRKQCSFSDFFKIVVWIVHKLILFGIFVPFMENHLRNDGNVTLLHC